MRIPLPELQNPNVIKGDRLTNASPDIAAPARELQGLGKALGGLVARASSAEKKVSSFKDRLAVENWTRSESARYDDDLNNGSPDGSGFMQRREGNLIKSFSEMQAKIADPEYKAEAVSIFNSVRENQLARGAEDIIRKAEGFAVASTADGTSEAMATGQIATIDQYTDYFENVAKPKLASVIDDPVRFEMASGEIARTMREAYVTKDPSLAIYASAKPEGGIWAGMEDGEWTSLSTKAVKQDAERVKAEAEARKVADDATVKSGYDMALNGSLNAEWIEGNKDALPPAIYRQFGAATRRVNQDGKTNNTQLVSILNAALSDDDQSSVQDDAFKSFAEGDINKADFARVLTASRLTEQQKVEKPWLASIRKSFAARLAPVDSEDFGLYAKRLEGVDALDQWVSANPGAKPDEVAKKAKEISSEYISNSVAETRKTLTIPRYAGGPRTMMTAETLPQAAQRLADAYKTGKVNPGELNREATLIRRWANLFDEESNIGPA